MLVVAFVFAIIIVNAICTTVSRLSTYALIRPSSDGSHSKGGEGRQGGGGSTDITLLWCIPPTWASALSSGRASPVYGMPLGPTLGISERSGAWMLGALPKKRDANPA
jgi:hypothetical protein